MPNGFTAACVSTFGLVRALGTTLPALVSEVDTGIMIIGSSDEWIKRTKAKFPAGPTGPWVDEWWGVWNYLQYGAGACIIGGTGAVWGVTMDDYQSGNPLDSYTDPFNVIFGLDMNTNDIYTIRSSNKHATKSALLRGNVFAILGSVANQQYVFKTGDTGAYTCVQNGTFNPAWCQGWLNGFTFGFMQSGFGLSPSYGNYRNWGRAVYANGQLDHWEGVDENGSHGYNPQYIGGTTHGVIITIGAQKNYIRSWSNAGYDKNEIAEHNFAPDFAGAMGRAIRDNYPWSIPAGLIKGRILNCIKLKYDFTPEQRTNAAPHGIFFPENIPGKGFFFMGNLTQAGTYLDNNGELKRSSLGKMDFHSVINYMKKTIKEVAYTYLFEPNNAANRDAFKTTAENILAGISATGAIGFYKVECDDTQPQNQNPENLYARIVIQPIDTIKNIELNVSVTPTGVQTEISDTFIL